MSSDFPSTINPPEVPQQVERYQEGTSQSSMSGIPGDVNAFHDNIHGDPMDIDKLISHDTESTLPTGSGNRPMSPKSMEIDKLVSNHMETALPTGSGDRPMSPKSMQIDKLISNNMESTLPTGSGDSPMPPKSDHDHVENNAMDIPEDRHDESVRSLPSLDLADKIKGYRLLELISEQASNGLVNKVIISPEPLSRFINYVSPGAYASLTHVDFAALDQFLIKPIGVYGSKSQIVRLLLEIKAVDEDTASLLLMPRTEQSMHAVPSLASGLYIFEAPSEADADAAKRFYVVYWPEDTTWDDDAMPSVTKNRVTFIRYLTKIADQILALVSSEHARELDLDKFAAHDKASEEQEEDHSHDRMFSFSVAKTNEQSEDVTARPGFELSHQQLGMTERQSQCPIEHWSALQPTLVAGETRQAFLAWERMTEVRLGSLIQDRNIRLGEELDDEGLGILSDLGLGRRFSAAVTKWKQQNEESNSRLNDATKRAEGESKLHEHRGKVEVGLENTAIQQILESYGSIFSARDLSDTIWKLDQKEVNASMEYLGSLGKISQQLHKVKINGLQNIKPQQLPDESVYKRRKNKFLIAAHILGSDDRWTDSEKRKLVGAIWSQDRLRTVLPGWLMDKKGKSTGLLGGIRETLVGIVSTNDPFQEVVSHAKTAVAPDQVSDVTFITQLPVMCDKEPALIDAAVRIGQIVRDNLKRMVEKVVRKVYAELHRAELDLIRDQLRLGAKITADNEKRSSRAVLMQEINDSYGSDPTAGVTLEKISVARGSIWKTYEVSWKERVQTPARLHYTAYLLALTADDNHKLSLDTGYDYVPRPQFRSHPPKFSLPVGHHIGHMQLFQNDRCLLIVRDEIGNLKVFLEHIDALDNAIQNDRTKSQFSHTKLGSVVRIAVDEARALLVIVSSDSSDGVCRLHVYRLMENFATLALRGTPMPLYSWHDRPLRITHACFVSGKEEIFLVDDREGRIYSFVTQQWRPATLHLIQQPSAIFSTPDGACLVAIEQNKDLFRARLYHWESFGSNPGLEVDLPDIQPTSFSITSLAQRNVVHALVLSSACHKFQSVSLHITRQSSEFMFRQQGGRDEYKASTPADTQHNSLIDCHRDAWTRFPVVPAVSRSTIRIGSRAPAWLQFVTEDVNLHQRFALYWRDMITSFETSTRKPTEGVLQHCFVSGTYFDTLSGDWCRTSSEFHAGEWLVELLSLIPIQICITRDNRFIPLKDGVWSPDLERSLLGADLNQIVESLSFGWYESLFQSYYRGRQVKVVSSMGQQSVGKSYMINHFTDCSFEGSAMRTTEGCWMSCTPTDECLVVSLDFEGMDSIERSSQEDTLLVLFNAAISNLVLFRNNFALSRDIATSFQSFQSSSLVLNPASNPTLFQGKLAIIVKDVIDSDSKEIVKEFSEKLHRIVVKEQDSNFITRMHKGQITIIPWPVIESSKFYSMFHNLKKVLYSQPITHPGAGIFLSTLKTLMAKLKTNDWGALDQNLGSLRAQTLDRMLPTAFTVGMADAETQEPLKACLDIDSDKVIPPGADSSAVFYLSSYSRDPADASIILGALRNTFASEYLRTDPRWVTALCSHFSDLGDARIKHVQDWLDCNSSRFSSHAEITELQRKCQDAIVQLKAGLLLCKMQCQQCHLVCIEPRHHSKDHTCHTDHTCGRSCDFCNEYCGLPAGHDSKHICIATAHLCGRSCDLKSKRGCLGHCTKEIDHIDDEHMCSSRKHECGEPCALADVPLPASGHFTCHGRCATSCDEPHDLHACQERSCPISCQLCKRLCCLGHLHGLQDSIHFCGESHSCSALCAAQGACEISTVPLRVESTFTGKLETFQFTKYSQVVKRLPCGLHIPGGALEHEGPHQHSKSPDAFHYCEARCPNCDYLCTLPYDHTQTIHETSHGSCSKTQWAIEGSQDAVLEVNGHKYAANDSGAPLLCSMMCTAFGRHAHVDYCRAEGTVCDGPQLQHIHARMLPHPDRPKDYVSHELFWERTGFQDPYTREEQTDFAKCDHLCGGPEHEASQGVAAQPSYCTLPMFHEPQPITQPSSVQGYVSTNGHDFACRNPSVGHQSFHVIFVIDRSGSMYSRDRIPHRGSSGNNRICDHGYLNRLGTVYAALYSFWTARSAALTALAGHGGTPPRRDAYSVILFNGDADVTIANDFMASPDELLDSLLPYGPQGGTSFDMALRRAHWVLENYWSDERSPVVIFLSDGECPVSDDSIYDLAQKSLALGKALVFHSVSFGPDGSSYYLRHMTDIASEVHSRAAPNVLAAPGAGACSYTEAIDTIRLAETFLGFAASLQKQRGSLLRA
ncbi:hypothetical protein JB92DRAFT_3033330 [Gautieria morchelliformis]|nr:hypothetical protein JB92DRAFT_3033330 [Gautieria morchelliformis]